MESFIQKINSVWKVELIKKESVILIKEYDNEVDCINILSAIRDCNLEAIKGGFEGCIRHKILSPVEGELHNEFVLALRISVMNMLKGTKITQVISNIY